MIIVTSTFISDIMQPDLSEILRQFSQQNTQFIYSNIFSQFYLFNSAFRQNQSGLNVLLIRLSDLLPAASATPAPVVEQFITEWSYTLSLTGTPMHVPLLILFTPIPVHLQTEADFFAQIATQIQQKLSQDTTITVFQATEIAALCTHAPVESQFFDSYPHIPYSLEFYQTLSMLIARHYASFSEQPYLVPIESLPEYITPMQEMIKRHLLGLCARHGLVITEMDTSFIATGMDSLQATLIATELLPIYHSDLTPARLLSTSMTLDTLMDCILQNKMSASPSTVLEKPDRIPLSLAQMRLWYDEKISEDTNRNHLFVAYDIPKHCDIALLERAFNTVIARHEAFRFAFHTSEEQPFITLQNNETLSFEIQQHRVADEVSLAHYMGRFQKKSFDLSQAPLLRVSVIQAPNATILLICIHQIIHDLWSLHTLCHELSILYHAYSHYIEPLLPPIKDSYSDFVIWQKQNITDDILSTQKDHWQNFLAKLPVTEFIYDKAKTKLDDPFCNERVEFQLDSATSLYLKQFAAQQQITLYELLISAFGLLISHYSGQEDISFLTATSGRHASKIQQSIGFFVNLLMVRFQIPEDIHWTELLKNNKKILKEILAHQDLPLHDILALTGETVNNPIFNQAAFIFLNQPKAALILHDQECPRISTYEDPALLFDACKECRFGNLVCFMQENENQILGVFEYNQSLFDPQTITHIIQAFSTLLTNIAYHPSDYAKAIPLLSEEQKNMLFQQGHPRYILGPHLNPMPIGAPGRLYVHENALARHSKAAPQKFIWIGKEHLCDTGDIVTWQIDGRLKYLTHENEQLEIDGYRIDPYKIETQLKTHAFVEEAIVMPNQDQPPVLIAYILLKDNRQLSEINLQQYLKPNLANYMLPKIYYQIEHFPHTYNGKIDKQLLATTRLQPVIYAEYESAQSPLQIKIMSIFAEVLRIDSSLIGINTNFFDLGGNSILALRLIHCLNEQFHIKINFSILYEYATVKLLSIQISSLLSKAHIAQRNQGPQFAFKKIKSGHPDNMPIIFIHPVGGTGFCYLDLIKLLPDEQPCYLIQDPSVDAHQMLFDDIVSMATYYNHALLKQMQSKPCILAGYSFGGMLALEMVGQLERKNLGHCVHSIFAFDTWIISNISDELDKANFKQQMSQEYERIAQQIRETQHTSESWMAKYYGQLQDLGMAYIPPTISKKIILFKAIQKIGAQARTWDQTNYLSAYTTQPIEIHPIACDHNSLLNWPYIEEIARLMVRYVALSNNRVAESV
ncbi:MAG: condensation domain-containing protein [Gammaproteobacteria bacterium]